MTQYAAKTDVSSQKSRDEIERTLTRYGADQFMYGWEAGNAVIAFRMQGRYIRFHLSMPDRDAREFTHTPERNTLRSIGAQEKAYEQAVRQRWRALALVVKAKLEAVETGISEFENEFMAHIVLPDGQTVGDFMRPQIALAYENGNPPKLLPSPGKTNDE